jgi:Ca-activated chloride channel family protein
MSHVQEPSIEILAARAAVCTDEATTLDVLVRIHPPAPPSQARRPPVNLGLVLDRSGSMGGQKKMGYAIDAASFAVNQLLPTDRVSVTIFDDEVEVLVPSTSAENRDAILKRLRKIAPRGSTALHGGWAAGAEQVRVHKVDGLNRVLLLSDGLANQGVTDPHAIARDVKALAGRGVGTSTMGLGDDYNEDLMEAMGRAGDGNYYYIQAPDQLPAIFQAELAGLMATTGQKVSLGIEAGPGVSVADVLNDFDRLPTGRHALPNLVVGMPILVVVRLAVAPRPSPEDDLVASFRLAWNPSQDLGRQSRYARLDLPAVPFSVWSNLKHDPAVREQEALLMSARAQKEAARALQQGNHAGFLDHMAAARGAMASCPPSPVQLAELADLDAIQARFDGGEYEATTKAAKFGAYTRAHSRKPNKPTP